LPPRATQSRRTTRRNTAPRGRTYSIAIYNYFAQPTAQGEFCNTAKAVLAQVATLDPAKLTDFAVEELPALEAPFWSPGETQVAEERAPDAVVAIAAAVPVAPSGF
jgi:hypothetical protein